MSSFNFVFRRLGGKYILIAFVWVKKFILGSVNFLTTQGFSLIYILNLWHPIIIKKKLKKAELF